MNSTYMASGNVVPIECVETIAVGDVHRKEVSIVDNFTYIMVHQYKLTWMTMKMMMLMTILKSYCMVTERSKRGL